VGGPYWWEAWGTGHLAPAVNSALHRTVSREETSALSFRFSRRRCVTPRMTNGDRFPLQRHAQLGNRLMLRSHDTCLRGRVGPKTGSPYFSIMITVSNELCPCRHLATVDTRFDTGLQRIRISTSHFNLIVEKTQIDV